jgi:hypothetical protein
VAFLRQKLPPKIFMSPFARRRRLNGRRARETPFAAARRAARRGLFGKTRMAGFLEKEDLLAKPFFTAAASVKEKNNECDEKSAANWVARWYILKTKIPILVHFSGP